MKKERENIIQVYCTTDKQYKNAKELQEQTNRLDPYHVCLKRVVIIDCRQQY